MKFKTIKILAASCFLLGCSNTDNFGYLDDHPEFSPIVQRKAKTEYQVVWSRSWRPTIYLKAHIEQDELGDAQRAFVSYGSAENSVPGLKKIEITMDQWLAIADAVDGSRIWSYDSKCDQLAYKERGIYFDDEDNGGCAEIIMMDGASISIAVSEPERKIGIYTACNDLGPCAPFGEIPRAMLRAIGREHEEN